MTHASIFSGIGGFDYAAFLLGWDNIFQCEIDPFCQRVLKHHFPNTDLYGDIKTTDFTKYMGAIDVISGGFPCQPFSVAGKQRGKEDDRFLWGEMLRCIQEVSPTWVVAENVHGLLTIENGLVFEQVCSDLESQGYEVQSFVIPACGVDAPHKRDRVWVVAYSSNTGFKNLQQERKNGIYTSGITSNTESARFKTRTSGQKQNQLRRGNERVGTSNNWENFPTQSPVCGRNDGFSDRLVDITFPKWRRESIKALGNAIVPAIAYNIFKAIEESNMDNKLDQNNI